MSDRSDRSDRSYGGARIKYTSGILSAEAPVHRPLPGEATGSDRKASLVKHALTGGTRGPGQAIRSQKDRT